LIDLAPEQVYDTVSVAWTGTSGKKHVETATQGNGAVYPVVEMNDDQRNSNNAKDYADRLLAEYGSERYSGTVTIYNGDRVMHAGRNLVITDWDQGKSLQHKITTITQREDSIQLTIGWPQIVSHFLARLEQKQKRTRR
jgi:Fic family protein